MEIPSDETQELAVELAVELAKMPRDMRVGLERAIKEMNKMPAEIRDQWAAAIIGYTPDVSVSARRVAKAERENHRYEDALEKASPEDQLKYTYLMNTRRLDKRRAQAQEDADQAGRWFRWTGLAGLGLLSLTILIGLVLSILDRPLPVAFFTGIATALSGFLAAIFHRRQEEASRTVDRFDEQVLRQQTEYISSLRQASGTE